MLAGLGPLLGEGELAASVYPDGRRVGVWHRDGQAGFGDYTQLRVRAPYRVRAEVPAAVLLGPSTASSAEVLAVALLGEGELAASVYPDGRRVGVWHRDGQAGFGDYTQLRVRAPYRVRAEVPAAVLLGPSTASSAEVLAVALRGRPATRSFGTPTRGLIAGNRTFTLADGASLVLTVAATTDRAGHVYAEPIVPDELVGGAESEADETLAAAVTWLAAGESCR
jgi:C-terminal processing protease CtpA/Prc